MYMHCIFDARSVWVKVEYRRPFSGCSIGDHRRPRSTFPGSRSVVTRRLIHEVTSDLNCVTPLGKPQDAASLMVFNENLPDLEIRQP